MQTWLSIEEFSKLIGKDVKEIENFVKMKSWFIK